jgi:2-methylcitrate dehydratase PrpD
MTIRPNDDIAAFATHLTTEDTPPEARRRAVDAITDCVGCSLAGSGTELAKHVLNVIATTNASGRTATLIGTKRRASAYDAALYNGAISHALDYDDISHPAYSHPSAVLVPAIFAAAEHTGSSGSDVVTAYIAGLETFGRLGRALNMQHYKNGWHATATFGSIAGAVAASMLFKLDEHAMRMAIGIAASASSGVRVNFGTMVKPLHAGYAARNGVFAALLAREGYTASEEALTGRFGFTSTFNHGSDIDENALRPQNPALEIMTEYGIALKAFPSCAATHPAIEAALMLRRQLADRALTISRVIVGASEFAFEPLLYVKPETGLQGKFSMYYCVASALVHGKVDLGTFSDEAVGNAAVVALIPKITMEVDERVRHDREFAAIVAIETQQGERLEQPVHIAPGKPARWLTPAQLKEKFRDCCEYSNCSVKAAEAFAALQAIERASSLSDVLPLITTA